MLQNRYFFVKIELRKGKNRQNCRVTMRKRKQGLATALLGVLLFVSGCSSESEISFHGLATEPMNMEEQENAEYPETESGYVQVAQETVMQTEAPETKERGYVYVCGAVAEPGVYPVTQDMRVFEAVACAGGFLEEADTQFLNLAAPVTDGQQICVYTYSETQDMDAVTETAFGQTASAETGKVNLNLASREELMTLPGIGESKADAIIQYRTEYGRFERIEDIMEISGIKEAVFSKIKNNITV